MSVWKSWHLPNRATATAAKCCQPAPPAWMCALPFSLCFALAFCIAVIVRFSYYFISISSPQRWMTCRQSDVWLRFCFVCLDEGVKVRCERLRFFSWWNSKWEELVEWRHFSGAWFLFLYTAKSKIQAGLWKSQIQNFNVVLRNFNLLRLFYLSDQGNVAHFMAFLADFKTVLLWLRDKYLPIGQDSISQPIGK